MSWTRTTTWTLHSKCCIEVWALYWRRVVDWLQTRWTTCSGLFRQVILAKQCCPTPWLLQAGSPQRGGHAASAAPRHRCVSQPGLAACFMAGCAHLQQQVTLDITVDVTLPTLPGPYLVGGHSYGGAVAVEIALLLESWGHDVGLVIVSMTWGVEACVGGRRQRLRPVICAAKPCR